MKTLELNQMENLQGGDQVSDCLAQIGLSAVLGGILLGGIGYAAFGLYASYQGVCEGL